MEGIEPSIFILAKLSNFADFNKFRTRDIGEENINKHAVWLAFCGEIWHKSNNSDYLSKLGSMPCFNRA